MSKTNATRDVAAGVGGAGGWFDHPHPVVQTIRKTLALPTQDNNLVEAAEALWAKADSMSSWQRAN